MSECTCIQEGGMWAGLQMHISLPGHNIKTTLIKTSVRVKVIQDNHNIKITTKYSIVFTAKQIEGGGKSAFNTI